MQLSFDSWQLLATKLPNKMTEISLYLVVSVLIQQRSVVNTSLPVLSVSTITACGSYFTTIPSSPPLFRLFASQNFPELWNSCVLELLIGACQLVSENAGFCRTFKAARPVLDASVHLVGKLYHYALETQEGFVIF